MMFVGSFTNIPQFVMRWQKKKPKKHVILVSDWLKLKKIFLSETASLSYLLVVANNVSAVHHRNSSFHDVTVKNMATMGSSCF